MNRVAPLAIALLVFAFLACGSVGAVEITVDEIIYPQSTVTNDSFYSGTVDMMLSGNTLTITLANTTSGIVGPESIDHLLTGVGFNLPDGIGITGGDVDMTGSTAINFTAPGDGDVSQEWGYDEQPLDSGAFQNTNVTVSIVDTAVSSMESQTTSQFGSGSIDVPTNKDALKGPDFGLVSEHPDFVQAVADAGKTPATFLGNGNEAIQDSVVITVDLEGDVPTDLLDEIEKGDVVLSFGSPDGDGADVPEPATWIFLGSGLAALALYRRMKFFRS